MNGTTNLVGYRNSLADKDVAFIMWAVNTYGQLRTPVHPGMVLFVALNAATRSLKEVIKAAGDSDSKEARAAKRVLAKLNDTHTIDVEEFVMSLNDTKVFRSARLITGKLYVMELPFRMKAQAGLQFVTFGKKWVKPDIDVSIHIKLERVKKGLWSVTVKKSLAQATKELLFEKYS